MRPSASLSGYSRVEGGVSAGRSISAIGRLALHPPPPSLRTSSVYPRLLRGPLRFSPRPGWGPFRRQVFGGGELPSAVGPGGIVY